MTLVESLSRWAGLIGYSFGLSSAELTSNALASAVVFMISKSPECPSKTLEIFSLHFHFDVRSQAAQLFPTTLPVVFEPNL
jgi:hypothetical protein